MAQGTIAPGGSPPPRIGEWLGESFDLFSKEWQTWIAQGAIYFFLAMGPVLVGGIIYYITMVGAILSTAGQRGGDPPPAFFGGMLLSLAALGIGSLLTMFLGAWLLAGMERTAAKQLRGEPIEVKDIFSGGDVFLPVLGAMFILSFGITIGTYLCIVPGLLLGALLLFTTPLIVERRMGVMEAMQTSWAAVKPHMWMYVLWTLLIGLVYYVGSLVIIGLIATLPIMILALMVSYRDVVGIPGALPSTRGPIPVGPAGGAYPPGAPVPAGQCPSCHGVVYSGSVVCPHCRTPLNPGGAPPAGP